MKIHSLPMRKLALLIAAAYGQEALAASAARIEFATAEPVIVSADGRERPASKGAELAPGDRVLTRNGRAQLAFTDGAFVSLLPNTDFGIREYQFNGRNDGSEKTVMSLVRGALRTVTGLIGRNKRDAYVMQTPSATIGIRGTGGRIEVNERGTFVAGTSGTWFIANEGGSIDVPAGAVGFAGPGKQEPPQLTSAAPDTTPTPLPPLTGFMVGEQQLGSAMSSGPGYAVLSVGPGVNLTVDNPTDAAFSSAGYLTGWASPANAQGTATLVQAGNDGLIGWGRWSNGVVMLGGTATTVSANQGLHYVVGIPTPVMPTGTAVYSVHGATKPTLASGTAAPGTLESATLKVALGGTSTVNFSVLAKVGGYTYSASGNQTITGAQGSLSSTSYVGTACGLSGCSGTLKILFTGSAAERAGLTYSIFGNNTFQTAVGAIVFRR